MRGSFFLIRHKKIEVRTCPDVLAYRCLRDSLHLESMSMYAEKNQLLFFQIDKRTIFFFNGSMPRNLPILLSIFKLNFSKMGLTSLCSKDLVLLVLANPRLVQHKAAYISIHEEGLYFQWSSLPWMSVVTQACDLELMHTHRSLKKKLVLCDVTLAKKWYKIMKLKLNIINYDYTNTILKCL